MQTFSLGSCLLSLGLFTATASALVARFELRSAQAHGTAPQAGALSLEQREILSYFSLVDLDDGQGGRVRALRISGANLQIVNGLGATNGFPSDPSSKDPLLTQTNGLGNLILGYNELGNSYGDARTGSHNLVAGVRNSYTGFGGQVVGFENTSGGAYTSVSGGGANRALAELSSISGGARNSASGSFAAVLGGGDNVASGSQSTVSGGGFNEASAFVSSVSGGSSRSAQDGFDWVAGSLVEDF